MLSSDFDEDNMHRDAQEPTRLPEVILEGLCQEIMTGLKQS